MADYTTFIGVDIRKIQRFFEIFTIIFGLFMVYQILRKIFGGSWIGESIIIDLLMANLICTFALAVMGAGMKSDITHKINRQLNNLTESFKNMAIDFKAYLKSKK